MHVVPKGLGLQCSDHEQEVTAFGLGSKRLIACVAGGEVLFCIVVFYSHLFLPIDTMV